MATVFLATILSGRAVADVARVGGEPARARRRGGQPPVCWRKDTEAPGSAEHRGTFRGGVLAPPLQELLQETAIGQASTRPKIRTYPYDFM